MNIYWILEFSKESQKRVGLCFIHYKALDCVEHEKLWAALKEMGAPQHSGVLMHNLCCGQEATVRTEYGQNGSLLPMASDKGAFYSPFI